MPLDQSWLDLEAASGGRAILKGSPEEIKAMYAGLVAALAPQFPKPSENVESKDGEVDGIKYRLYWPKNASGSLPTAIWTHGGGYMTGDLDSDDLLCRVVAEHTNSAVVNVDYRLTPEYKWPVQLDDCMKVYKWAHKNASTFHGDPNKFYTIGASAGGGLALQIANVVLRDPELKSSLKGICAMVPLSVHPQNVPEKYKSMYKAYSENTDTPILTAESMDIFYHHAGADPKDPGTFVGLAEDIHKQFPPTYLTSCEFDPLRDDAKIMEKALKDAGVPVKHDFYPGFPHYFWIFPSLPESQKYVGNLLGGIEWVKGQM
ncbi:Telomerase-binding protein [Recurvomyces mirabilis]|uniref:Telomerase-binding protein n=1 Tax=Recurvomyces mirabilis TaxID=574656 RepID=A0AAE1C4X8_9PEZI|nr:Telomerase-binding protein [Recurvomyces mirabilis]KAK5160689.1 Telomerase-binding protein [Recurvomyces mirabilis]